MAETPGIPGRNLRIRRAGTSAAQAAIPARISTRRSTRRRQSCGTAPAHRARQGSSGSHRMRTRPARQHGTYRGESIICDQPRPHQAPQCGRHLRSLRKIHNLARGGARGQDVVHALTKRHKEQPAARKRLKDGVFHRTQLIQGLRAGRIGQGQLGGFGKMQAHPAVIAGDFTFAAPKYLSAGQQTI